MENESYQFLFWGYTIFWLGLAGFMLFLFLRMKRVEERLEGIEREVERG